MHLARHPRRLNAGGSNTNVGSCQEHRKMACQCLYSCRSGRNISIRSDQENSPVMPPRNPNTLYGYIMEPDRRAIVRNPTALQLPNSLSERRYFPYSPSAKPLSPSSVRLLCHCQTSSYSPRVGNYLSPNFGLSILLVPDVLAVAARYS